MGDLLSPSHFVSRMSRDTRASLEEYGLKVPEQANIDGLDLVPLEIGEKVVGTLLPAEVDLLSEVVSVNKEMQALMAAMFGRHMIATGEKVLRGEMTVEASMQPEPVSFIDDAEAYRFHALAQRHVAIHALFHWTLGERLHLHDWRLGLREYGRIVAIERRW